MARRLLPGLVILPVVIGWIRITGEQQGLYKSEVGVILVALTYTICFIGLVGLAAISVNRKDKALRLSQERYFTTLASIGDAIIATDVNGHITFINKVGEELTGWNIQDALNIPVEEVFRIINENTRLEVESPVRLVLEKGKIVGLANHTILIRKDGTEVPIDDSGAPIKGQDGVIEGVVLVFRDISERKKAEKALYETNQRLTFHFENSPLAVVEWDSEYIVTKWSPEAERMFGWTTREVMGRQIGSLNMIYEPDIPIVEDTMKQLSGGSEKTVVSTNRNITKEGQIIECTWFNSVLTDEQGRMKSVMSLVQDNTEQIKSERLLKNSEQRYKFLVESLPDMAVLLFDNDHRFLIAGGHEIRRSGFDENMIEGHTLEEAYPPEVVQLFSPLYDKALKGEATRFDHNFGDFFYHQQVLPVYDSEGNIYGGLVISQNITESKKIEVALRESELSLHLAQQASRSGTWDWDLSAGLLHWTPELLSIFGLDPETDKASFEIWNRILHPDDSDNASSRIDIALKEHSPLDSTYRIIRPDGQIRWIRSTGEARYDDNNNPVRMLGICQDITDLKKSEEALKESEEQLKSALEAGELGTWGLDIQTKKAWRTLRHDQIFGYTELLSEWTYEMFLSHVLPEDVGNVDEKFGNAIATGTEWDFECRIRRVDGVNRWIWAQGKPIFNEMKEVVQLSGFVKDITDRKEAEEALREAKERTANILEGIAESFYSLDEQWRFEMINTAAERAPFGRPASELLGKVIWEEFPNLVGTYIHQHYLDAARDRSMHHYIAQSPLNKQWYEVFMQGWKGGVDVYLRDITERKQMEDQLKHEATRAMILSDISKMFTDAGFKFTDIFTSIARSVSDYLGDICIITQVSSDRQWLLPAAFHYSDEEAAALFQSIFPNEKIRMGEGIAGRVAQTGESAFIKELPADKLKTSIKKEFLPFMEKYGIHDFIIVPMKTEGQVLGTLGVMRMKKGKTYNPGDMSFLEVIASRAAMAITNIHLYESLQQSHLELEKKVSERTSELNKTMLVLSNEQKRFREVLDMLPSFVALLTPDHHFSFTNREFNNRFGETRGELCYKHLFNLDEPCETCNSKEVFSKNDCIFWEWQGPDGNIYDIADFPFTDADGSSLILKIGSDITKIKQAEEDRIARQVAEQANQAKSEFLANVSHEIRTPMNSIIGFSEILKSTIKDDKQRSQIDAIRSSSKNLLRLINDILDLSKIEAGKMMIHPEPVNLLNLISETEVVFAHRCREKGIRFFVESEKELPPALILDETRVRQILVNLLDNAVKFTDQGHVILTIDRNLRNHSRLDLILSIEDTGIGIPDDQQEQVFYAFSQQKGLPEKKYGGTGLGLTITRRLVEMMGGTVSLKSNPGEGSVFTVKIPDIIIVPDPRIKDKEVEFDIKSIRFKKSKVLIADDNFENRKLLIDLLDSTPIEMIEAVNGKEAVEFAEKHKPDLILMDLRMPEMNGYEATKILKSQESTKAIPVVALSASPKIIFNSSGDRDIFDDFIMKPVIVSDLAERLKKYLGYSMERKNKSGKKATSLKKTMVLTANQKKQTEILIRTLENEYLPVYKESLKKHRISQIGYFGRNLVTLGEESGSATVADFGKEICLSAESFDVEILMEKLQQFPRLIAELKKTMED